MKLRLILSILAFIFATYLILDQSAQIFNWKDFFDVNLHHEHLIILAIVIGILLILKR